LDNQYGTVSWAGAWLLGLLPKNNSPLDICLGSCIIGFVELIKKEKIVEFTWIMF
jgi:hypothetical protein